MSNDRMLLVVPGRKLVIPGRKMLGTDCWLLAAIFARGNFDLLLNPMEGASPL
jgi:hypothetical protein